jgi:DNA-binding transcriptional MerR regulator
MFAIGDFAKHGRVSVRMLRHYDAIGLLRPAHVDPASGYRFYDAGQLARLNRVIALKELGFSLQQVATILDEHVSTDELRGMLRLRQAELAEAMSAAAARLAQVEARLRTIESEGRMSTTDIVLKTLPPVRLAEQTAIAASYEPEDIGPVIQPLFAELACALDSAGVTRAGRGTARYEDAPDGAIVVHAGFPVAPNVDAQQDFEIVELPAELAATVVHDGSMDDVLPTAQALAYWIDANGYRSTGYARELTLAGPGEKWVTELQEPVVRA